MIKNPLFVCMLALLYSGCVNSDPSERYEIGSEFTDCAECPEMVVLPPGEYLMGSPDTETDRREHEGPQRLINLTDKFAVSRFEITHRQFGAFVTDASYMPANNCMVWTLSLIHI